MLAPEWENADQDDLQISTFLFSIFLLKPADFAEIRDALVFWRENEETWTRVRDRFFFFDEERTQTRWVGIVR